MQCAKLYDNIQKVDQTEEFESERHDTGSERARTLQCRCSTTKMALTLEFAGLLDYRLQTTQSYVLETSTSSSRCPHLLLFVQR